MTERPAEPTGISITTFGSLIVKVGSKDVQLNNRKSRAVIGYLALSETLQESRERLVGMLWSEVDESKARGSLRTTLHEIRGAFHAAGYDGLETDKLKVGLRSDGLSVDVRAVLDEARAGRVHPLLLERDHLFEQLLAGFDDLDRGFRTWLLSRRQKLHDRVLFDLVGAMRSPMATPPQRELLARAIANLDPTHEEAARVLIEARYAAGDLGGALGIYKRLWELLAAEHDSEPLPETQSLIARIKLGDLPTDQQTLVANGSTAGQAGPGATSPTLRLVVSLGAFDAAPVPAEQRYLVQEFRRELIASLVRFREWVVRDVPGGTATTATPSEHEIVLDGGAYQTEAGVRLVLTLRDLAQGTYLWGEKLDISPQAWWASQRVVVQRMAAALNVHVSAGRLAMIARRPDAHLSAYDLWLRGQATMRSFEEDDWHKAAEIFRNLIARTPTFAPCYSSLAQLHNSIHVSHYGVFRDQKRRDEALAAAREAVRLDPSDSRGLLSLGWSLLMAQQFDQAVVNFELAVDLNDTDPWTTISSALGLAFSGELDAAKDHVRKAQVLSPMPSAAHWGYQLRVHALSGDYAAAIEALPHAAPVPALPAWAAVIFAQAGRLDDARRELSTFYSRSQDRWCGTRPWSPDAAVEWFLHAFPLKSEESWKRLHQGMALAGAPVGQLKHRFWDTMPPAY